MGYFLTFLDCLLTLVGGNRRDIDMIGRVHQEPSPTIGPTNLHGVVRAFTRDGKPKSKLLGTILTAVIYHSHTDYYQVRSM